MEEKIDIESQEDKIDPLTTAEAEIYMEGLHIAAEMGSISCVMLQRKLRIGYAFAFRILEWLIEQEFIEKRLNEEYTRKTLITTKEYERFRECIEIPVKEPIKEKVEDFYYIVENNEKLYKDALSLVVDEEMASISLLQRKLSIGFCRAEAIIKRMEQEGLIESFSGEKERKILLTKEKFKELYK